MPSASADDDPVVLLPQDYYPDADVIITQGDRGVTIVTFKAYGSYLTDDSSTRWLTEIYRGNTDLVLRDLSTVQGTFKVVFDGANVKRLTIFNVDSKQALNSGVVLDFKMYGGKISSFSLLSVSKSVTKYLATSYDVMPSPIRSVTLDLKAGSIDLINPTSVMVAISSYEITLDRGMTVNRLYTTGENGKYSSVKVKVYGASIGYMANIASKIGYLEYVINSGHIDYLCLGANTEHTSRRTLSTMATSYVSGDVSVQISNSAKVDSCIMGGGILNIPRVLCNGEIVSSEVIHMILIDAPNVTVYNDTAFLNERHTQAYHFNDYVIGQSPYPESLMDTFNYGKSYRSVYADDGLWGPISSATLPAGGVFSINTKFLIQAEGTFLVSKGSSMINSNDVIVSGTLDVQGRLLNNSIIQSRPGSTVNGDIDGIGFVTDYIYYSTPVSVIDVMSQTTSVVIEQSSIYPVESIFVQMPDDLFVDITISGSQRIFADQVMITLICTGAAGDFFDSYRLEIKGIDKLTLSLCKVDVKVPVDGEGCTAVYVYNTATGKYDIRGMAEYEDTLKFDAGIDSMFYLREYVAEGSDQPVETPTVPVTEISEIEYWFIAAIISVIAAAVYVIVTMRRDRS